MSSSHSRNRSKKTSYQTSYYPTKWSEWEWDLERKNWRRYRLVAPNEYEFEYESRVTATDPAEPRTPQASMAPVQEGSYSASANYALSSDPTADITRGLAQTTLNVPRNQTSVGASELTHITTANPCTREEDFDPHYKVHKAFEFKQGRVFKVLWAEPQGAGSGQGDESSSTQTVTERVNKYGEISFQKVRRFVIIRPLSGHCICLPINTYSRQGVTKNGVHAGDHTIAYSGSKPIYFKGERSKGMTKKPLKIVTKNPRHKLADTSRLNYAKTYTVEYNVKVWFIGNVDKDHMWHLITDFNQVHPPLGTYGMTQPAYQDEETSYADGGMDEYSIPARAYGPSLSSSSTTSYARAQYSTTYDNSQSSYTVAPEEYTASHAETPYEESRSSGSKGKGKKVQRDHLPEHDIAEVSEEQDHVYDQPYEDPPEPEFEAQYEDAYSQARHDEGAYAAHEVPHSEAAEYDTRTAYEYPAATEAYPEENYQEYAERIVVQEEASHRDEQHHDRH